MKELISVIIPVYNAEKTLEKCVDSIIKQTYRFFEIILVDDGSKDLSGNICDMLTKNLTSEGYNITTIHQKNKGVSNARNTGIRAAAGEFFVCVDSDDIVGNEYLYDFIKCLKEHPEVGHVWCGFECVSQSHKKYVFSEKEPISYVDRSDYLLLSRKILSQSPCFHLYRTDVVINKNILMPEDISLAEDLIFNLRYLDAIQSTTIAIINKPNYIYCDEDASSLNHKYRENLYDIYKLVHESIKFYMIKWGCFNPMVEKEFYDSIIYDYGFLFTNTLSKQNKDSLLKKMAHNSKLMKQEEFQNALKKKGMKIPKLILLTMKSGSYPLYLFVFNTRNYIAKIYWKNKK